METPLSLHEQEGQKSLHGKRITSKLEKSSVKNIERRTGKKCQIDPQRNPRPSTAGSRNSGSFKSIHNIQIQSHIKTHPYLRQQSLFGQSSVLPKITTRKFKAETTQRRPGTTPAKIHLQYLDHGLNSKHNQMHSRFEASHQERPNLPYKTKAEFSRVKEFCFAGLENYESERQSNFDSHIGAPVTSSFINCANLGNNMSKPQDAEDRDQNLESSQDAVISELEKMSKRRGQNGKGIPLSFKTNANFLNFREFSLQPLTTALADKSGQGQDGEEIDSHKTRDTVVKRKNNQSRRKRHTRYEVMSTILWGFILFLMASFQDPRTFVILSSPGVRTLKWQLKYTLLAVDILLSCSKNQYCQCITSSIHIHFWPFQKRETCYTLECQSCLLHKFACFSECPLHYAEYWRRLASHSDCETPI